MECAGSCYYYDGELHPVRGDEEFPSGDLYFYEVIRTRDGAPLFFDDHLNRMKAGISTRYLPAGDLASEIRHGFSLLVERDPHPEINVRVTVIFTEQSHQLHICYIPSFYPSPEMVSSGVPLVIYHAERLEPGVKMLNQRLRLSVDAELKRSGAYEALLVNRDGEITEGSRSNVFFISDEGQIFTAPDGAVLQGITRRYVVRLIVEEGLSLRYEAVRETDIGRFRSAFITGTSPMVLPVRSIGGVEYDASDTVIARLRSLYSDLAERSITAYRTGRRTD